MSMKYTGPSDPKRGYWMEKEADREKAAGTRGKLRKRIGAKAGKPIPSGKLAKAAKAGGSLGKEARMAEDFKKAKH